MKLIKRHYPALVLLAALFAAACGTPLGNGPSGPSPTPSFAQRYAYVTNQADDTVSQYSIGSDGSVTPLPQPTVRTGSMPVSIAADSSGRYIYVANQIDNSISQFSVGGDGSLAALPVAAVAAGDSPSQVVLSPDRTSLYSVNGASADISRYTIGSDGSLSLAGTSAAGVGTPLSLRFDPSGQFAYVASTDLVVAQFSVGADGALSPLSTPTVPTTDMPAGPLVTARSALGTNLAYVLICGDNSVQAYPIAADGTLGASASTPTGACPMDLAVSATNLYVTNLIDQTISMYSIALDGSLSPMPQPTVPAGAAPQSLALSPSGQFAYATDFSSQVVLAYAVGADGVLSALPFKPAATGTAPSAILIKE
jgi:6-phosphogluconolactonase (cycloisomerase 2 family)